MLLQKTEKARLELSPGVRTLSLRERSLLLLADGKMLAELQAMYNGSGAQIVERLVDQGYLTGFSGLTPDTVAGTPAPAPLAALPASPPSSALRSLAGTRMYLFDICERMFARRNAILAENFREALRSARDRDSMLDVGEALLQEISLLAGPERAAAVREGMEQLLPTLCLEPVED